MNNKKDELSSLTKGFVKDEDLADTPSRVFRKLLRKCLNVNPAMWNSYLKDYIKLTIGDDNTPEKRKQRGTIIGNAKDEYFCKNTLTLNKFLSGLSILKMKKCKITFEIEDLKGNKYTLDETLRIISYDNIEKDTQDKDEIK